jgi:hypothetical protein
MAVTEEARTKLYTCAFCPNICRPSYPAQDPVQIESQTPSALCLLTIAVLKKQLPHDDATNSVLSRRAAAIASREHCVYGMDIPALLDDVLAATEA